MPYGSDFFHNTNAHVLIACEIYFKKRFLEARISGGRDRWMRKRKSEIRRKRREMGSRAKHIKLQLY